MVFETPDRGVFAHNACACSANGLRTRRRRRSLARVTVFRSAPAPGPGWFLFATRCGPSLILTQMIPLLWGGKGLPITDRLRASMRPDFRY